MMTADWLQMSSTELLDIRLCDLALSFETSDIWPRVSIHLRELGQKLPRFFPYIFVGDEWFSPEGVASVSVPFFLLHPRLRELENEMMGECEGESEEEFSKIFRHELGHAFDHAFHISKRPLWKKHFGCPRQSYAPEHYPFDPSSKNFVINLKDHYAQAHPDEDFAETFAVWLDTNSNWSENYADWKALDKLKYIDRLIHQFQTRSFVQRKTRQISEARFLKMTLRSYYERKSKPPRSSRAFASTPAVNLVNF